jgi:Protein of unknown function (DUF4236)
MAWRFRRGARFGPFRLNFSKSGVGYSVGARGFRIGKDARGRSYTATSIPGTGIYNRQYSSASRPTAQGTVSPTTASPQSGNGNGLKIFLAFVVGGVVFSAITAIVSSSPAVPPAPAPATVSTPIVPSPVTLAKRHLHGSTRAGAPGRPHPSAVKVSHTSQAPPRQPSDAVPPVN